MLCLLAGLGLCMAAAVSIATPAAAAIPSATVSVAGTSLGGLGFASPYGLNPVFSPATTDYFVRCQAGRNLVSLTLTGNGGPITVSTNQEGSAASGTTVEISLDVVPNQAIVVSAPSPGGAPGTTQYWVRCLPPDFPTLQVDQAGPASPGWTPGYYFTGNITSTNGAYYAMVLDGNGVPVWYQKVPTGAAGFAGAINVEPLNNDTIVWTGATSLGIGVGDSPSVYTGFDLATQTAIASLPAAVAPTDPHELLPLPNGDRMMISTPLVAKGLSTLGNGRDNGQVVPASEANNTVVDCVVQEVNPSNQAVWTWDAAPHIGLDEVNTASGLPYAGPSWELLHPDGVVAADIYHCNSVAVDEDPSSPYFGDVLVSMRHLNAVFLIDRTTGNVIWKLGGTAFTSNDPEVAQRVPAQHLSITGDSETQFCGQHDARFVPTPNPAVEDVERVRRPHGLSGCVTRRRVRPRHRSGHGDPRLAVRPARRPGCRGHREFSQDARRRQRHRIGQQHHRLGHLELSVRLHRSRRQWEGAVRHPLQRRRRHLSGHKGGRGAGEPATAAADRLGWTVARPTGRGQAAPDAAGARRRTAALGSHAQQTGRGHGGHT